jgi:hypothetical protein
MDKILNSLMLEPLEVQAPFEAFMLPVSSFPVPEDELIRLKHFLSLFTATAVGQLKLSVEVFVHMTRLQHRGGSSVRFSSHGREWLPKLGLGIWPDRPPPTLWTQQDFRNLAPGEMPRNLMDQVFLISKSAEAKENARDIMLGVGAVVQVLTPDPTATFLKNAQDLLLPPIKDPSYSCFPFYVPLLEKKSILGATQGQLDSWFCGASLYIRESFEDAGLLIASRVPLDPVVRKIGGRSEPERRPGWVIPL